MPKSKLTNIDHAAVPSAVPTKSARVSRRSAALPLPAPSMPSAPAPMPEPTTAPTVAPLGKHAQVLAMLHRPRGTTIAEMMTVTGWMSHSVRGLLSAGIKRKLGLVVASTVEPERGRVYRIAPPAPVTPTPVPPQGREPAGRAKASASASTTTVRRRRTVRGTAASGAHTVAG